MSTITLVTGGAASGKSRWAINYFATCDNVLYINTSEKIPESIRRRIEFNCSKNDVMWELLENVDNPCKLILGHKFFIFDGLASYTQRAINEEFDDAASISYEQKKKIEKKIVNDVQEMMSLVEALHGDMVIITVETGFSVEPDDPRLAIFREIVGVVNQRIANIAQEVFLSASGIQFRIK